MSPHEAWQHLAKRPEWREARKVLLGEVGVLGSGLSDGALRELTGRRSFAAWLLTIAEKDATTHAGPDGTPDSLDTGGNAGGPGYPGRALRGLRRRVAAPERAG